MHIADAIYSLSAIQQLRRGTGSSSSRKSMPGNRDDTVPVSRPSDNLTPNSVPAATGKLETLSDMLNEHFAEEVRLRDRDGDGQLTPSEFGGSAGEFAVLDGDGDGRIKASDLIHAAMEKNAELKEMVTGHWAPIYNAILNSNSNDPAILETAVRNGGSRVVQQMRLREQSSSRTIDSSESPLIQPTQRQTYEDQVRIGAIVDEFLDRHDDLIQLRDRLTRLADRLGRSRRYHPVNDVA